MIIRVLQNEKETLSLYMDAETPEEKKVLARVISHVLEEVSNYSGSVIRKIEEPDAAKAKT